MIVFVIKIVAAIVIAKIIIDTFNSFMNGDEKEKKLIELLERKYKNKI